MRACVHKQIRGLRGDSRGVAAVQVRGDEVPLRGAPRAGEWVDGWVGREVDWWVSEQVGWWVSEQVGWWMSGWVRARSSVVFGVCVCILRCR